MGKLDQPLTLRQGITALIGVGTVVAVVVYGITQQNTPAIQPYVHKDAVFLKREVVEGMEYRFFSDGKNEIRIAIDKEDVSAGIVKAYNGIDSLGCVYLGDQVFLADKMSSKGVRRIDGQNFDSDLERACKQSFPEFERTYNSASPARGSDL